VETVGGARAAGASEIKLDSAAIRKDPYWTFIRREFWARAVGCRKCINVLEFSSPVDLDIPGPVIAFDYWS